jgi:hypothetical protein
MRSHRAWPIPETVTRLDGSAVSLLDLQPYGAWALCMVCNQAIETESWLIAPWVHRRD